MAERHVPLQDFRNIGIIGRLGSTQVLDSIRRLKRFLLDRHLHVILEDTIAEVLPGHGLQTCSRKILGEVCDLVIVVGGEEKLSARLELHAKVGLGSATVAAVRSGERGGAGGNCSGHIGLIS